MIQLLHQCIENILNAASQHIQRWTKLDSPYLFTGAGLDLTRSKAELILENPVLRQQLIVFKRQVKHAAIKPHERYQTSILIDSQSSTADFRISDMFLQGQKAKQEQSSCTSRRVQKLHPEIFTRENETKTSPVCCLR